MKRFKKTLISLIAVCLLFSATGCIVQINNEKNRNIVVALIDNKYEIKKGDYLDMFNYYASYYYSAYGIDISTQPTLLTSIRDACIQTLIQQKICEIEMDKIEFYLNDEDRAKAREDFEEDIKTLADQYKQEAEEEEAEATATPSPDDETEERDFYQEARDYYLDLLAQQDMTEEAYIDEIAQEYRLERYKKFIMSDLVVSDEDIQNYYNEQLDEQQLSPNLDAEILLYEPSGVSYKYIKVALTTTELAEYNELVEADKDDEAEAYLKNTSYKRAVDYLARIKAGESFEDVMKDANEYLIENCGEDEDSIKAPEDELKLYKSVGTTGFAGVLDTKLLAAETGAVTGVLDATDGVYVIGKCYGRFASVTHSYEVGNDIYNAIKERLEEDLIEENWETEYETLKNNHDIKIYTNQINKDY